MIRWWWSRQAEKGEAPVLPAPQEKKVQYAPPVELAQSVKALEPMAVASDPALAQTQFELANQALASSQLGVAERYLRQAVSAQANHLNALCNLGALLKDQGRPAEAEIFLARALEIQPRSAVAAFNLGLLRLERRQWSDAVMLLRIAASAKPKDADSHYWLGNALIGYGDAAAARKSFQAALRCDPGRSQARWGLAIAQIPPIPLTDAAQAAGAQAFGQELSRLKAWFGAQPTLDASATVAAQQPFYLAYGEADHRATLAEYGALCSSLMGNWAKRTGIPAPASAGGSKWRIGIVSAHVHSHSVWHALLKGWIEHLDPSLFELHIFYTGVNRDAETEWAARHVARLHHQIGDWKAWARLLADSRLDALLYPEIGMDVTTFRLASMRLAGMQLASWGHPITSGLPTIDAYVSAQAFEPADADTHYTERLITLPRLGCFYRPYGTSAATIDFATFGINPDDRVLLCAGNPFKYAPRHDRVLVEIARRCAPCKLVFFRQENSMLAEQLQGRLEAAFTAAGLAPSEILRFVPWQSQAAFFGFLDRADIYLDSLGFSGFNTAMQAMERGVPIVAFEGRYMRGRFASAILKQAGLNDWVADTAEGFIDRVDRLVRDVAARDLFRRQIRASAATLYADKASVTAFSKQLDDMLYAKLPPKLA